MKRFFTAALLCIMLFGLFSPCYAAYASAVLAYDEEEKNVTSNDDQILKVGLNYGSNALASANLANEAGSGYSLGYFNDSREFVKLLDTSEEKISILKDETIYIASDYTYTDTSYDTGLRTINTYHLQTENSFQSGSDALQAALKIESAHGIRAFPAYIGEVWRVRIGNYSSLESAKSDIERVSGLTGYSYKAFGKSSNCFTVTKTKTDNVIFQLDSSSLFLGIMPVSSGGEKAETWFKGLKYFGGFEYKRINGGNITVINVIELQDYTKGVLPYEMGPSWPMEALKAQALCAKSYAMSNLNKHKSYGFDICCTTDCQVYMGTKYANESTDKAVDSTYHKYITYEGRHITPFYHSSNGGSTENSENVWSISIPYLRAVKDNYEDLDLAFHGTWQSMLDLNQITAALKSKEQNINKVSDIYVKEFTDAGNVYSIAVVDSSGKELVYSKEAARTILNTAEKTYVYSMRFNITGLISLFTTGGKELDPALNNVYAIGGNGGLTSVASNADNGVYVISSSGTSHVKSNSSDLYVSGTGWGHNVGMSQWGARGMAEQGFTYDQILKYYYTGVEISEL